MKMPLCPSRQVYLTGVIKPSDLTFVLKEIAKQDGYVVKDTSVAEKLVHYQVGSKGELERTMGLRWDYFKQDIRVFSVHLPCQLGATDQFLVEPTKYLRSEELLEDYLTSVLKVVYEGFQEEE